ALQMRPLRDDDLRRLDAPVHDGRRRQLGALARQDLAPDLAADDDALGLNVALELASGPDRDAPLGPDLSFDLALEHHVFIGDEVADDARAGSDEGLRARRDGARRWRR